MQAKKAIFLGLALILPISIFIFLKLFGKNEFDVPAFYQEELPPPSESCKVEYTTPYLIPDSIMNKMRKGGVSKLYLVRFTPTDIAFRIKEKINPGELTFMDAETILYYDDAYGSRTKALKECVFISRSGKNLVLVDDEKRIRGYYDGLNRDDVDRFLLEYEILLKKY